jgi:hypothetical protein
MAARAAAPLAAQGASATAESYPVHASAELALQFKVKGVAPGEPFTALLRIDMEPGVQLQPVKIYPQALGWELRGVSPGMEQIREGKIQREEQLTLVTYAEGKQDFPALILPFADKRGRSAEFRTAAFAMETRPLPKRPGDRPGSIRGLKGPVGFISWWTVLLWLLGLLVLAGLLLWIFRRRIQQALAPRPVPPRPAHEVALERLAALQRQHYGQTMAAKAYYSELSDILRRYLAGRYALDIMDCTTVELLKELKASSGPRALFPAIREVLETSDLVKFAKDHPAPGQAVADWQRVSEVVASTRPLAESKDQAGGAR